MKSRYGLAFEALREDQLATQNLGFNTTEQKLMASPSPAFSQESWGPTPHYFGILSPIPEEFGVDRTVEILTISYVGGRRALWGRPSPASC